MLVGLSCAIAGGCGLVKGGVPGLINDPVPNGPVKAQGSFTTVKAGKEVTGIVSVYQLSSTGEYIIRLQSLVAPTDTGLLVMGSVNGSPVQPGYSLRGPTGNQNYPTGINTPGLVWTTVSILNPAYTVQQEYATATLTAPTH